MDLGCVYVKETEEDMPARKLGVTRYDVEEVGSEVALIDNIIDKVLYFFSLKIEVSRLRFDTKFILYFQCIHFI